MEGPRTGNLDQPALLGDPTTAGNVGSRRRQVMTSLENTTETDSENESREHILFVG